MISHEVRTPMNGILGMVQLLNGTRLTKTQAAYLQTVQRSCDNLVRLVDDVMDLSSIEAGTLTLSEEPFDPALVIEDVLDQVRSSASAKGLSLDVTLADDLPPLLSGDPLRIKQVLFHLLSNAVKVTERGGVRLRLHVLNATPDENNISVRFSVSDDGPGIPEAARPWLFQQFVMGDASPSRAHGGVGIGPCHLQGAGGGHGRAHRRRHRRG